MIKFLVITDRKSNMMEIKDLFDMYSYFSNDIFEVDYHVGLVNYAISIKSIDFDIIVLNLSSDKLEGIGIATEIRKLYRSKIIVLISDRIDYLIDGYNIKSELYLIKPINQKIFNSCFDKLAMNYKDYHSGFYINMHEKIFFKDILYIHIYKRKSIIYLFKGDIIQCKLESDELGKIIRNFSFQQCHKSYIINFRYIYA